MGVVAEDLEAVFAAGGFPGLLGDIVVELGGQTADGERAGAFDVMLSIGASQRIVI